MGLARGVIGAQVFASAVGLFVAAIMSAVMDSFDITLPFALATVVVVSDNEPPALWSRRESISRLGAASERRVALKPCISPIARYQGT